MFFKTQISKVNVNSAVDVAGRRLVFAGNLPCQAGDFVWTDGRVIFGNIQPQATPYFFDDSTGGVPVLADTLRGYFDKNGNFKSYSIADDSWIVNDDKIFAHGNSDIYDAEISYDGDLLTSELINSSLMRVYKNNKAFYDVDAKSISGLNFIDDDSVSAVYDAEFVNFKLLRDGTYDALVKPIATVVTPDSGGDEGGEVQTTIIDQLFTRAEFLAADFPFEHTEYGGHPLFKKALLDFWERCLFADYSVTDDDWRENNFEPPDNLVYNEHAGGYSTAGDREFISGTDRNYRLGAYFLNGHIKTIRVEIRQTTQGTSAPTVNVQGGISRVSNGTVTSRKKAPADQSFISGERKGNFGETGNEDDITYTGGNFFNVSSAIGTADFDANGNYIFRQTRIKKYLLQPFDSRDECLWLNPSDGEYYPLPEYYKESSWNRIWRDPNGHSIPLYLLYCPFESMGNDTTFYFYETAEVAPINDTVADDEYGLTYRFRLSYDITDKDSTTTVYTPYFMLAIKGKYKQYTRKTIDPSGGGSDTGGSAGTTEYLQFPVQDGFYFDEQFDAVLDSDSNIIFSNPIFSIEDKLSATQLKGGKFLVGKKDSALYLVNDGQAEKTFDGCNNFRLRYLKNISKAKK